ncbi:unnamed protein product [Symbiodinium sp. CCMP2592]|nr:unnamed protein product [Symbiodinium sp. CCMP2592]
MVSWVVLEEMKIPYVMDTTPLRAYLRPGEKKRQRLVPVIQLWDQERSGSGSSWVFQAAMRDVGRGEQVCAMLAERFGAKSPWPKARPEWLQLFSQLQKAHSAYKRLPGGKPTWGVSPSHGPKEEEHLASALDALEEALGASEGSFLGAARPHMVDLMLLPILERVEALLLHPFLASGPRLSNWASVSEMLSTGRRPGICSFGELCSDAETLLAISLREDPGRTSAMPLPRNAILSPALSVLEAAEAAAQHSQEACREAAARICSNHSAIVSFACCGRGCGRRTVEARKMAEGYPGHNPEVDLALRQVVESLLRASCRDAYPSELESAARRAARSSAAALALAPLRFLSQNIGVPRDMAALPAGALRAHLRLHLAACENQLQGLGGLGQAARARPRLSRPGRPGRPPERQGETPAASAAAPSRRPSSQSRNLGRRPNRRPGPDEQRSVASLSAGFGRQGKKVRRQHAIGMSWWINSLLLAKFIALTTNFSYIGVGVLENLC